MIAVPVPLDDGEIADRLAALRGWKRDGGITRIYLHSYHECLYLVHVRCG